MNLRAFTDNMQLTMLMVILCQILNTTHMLPLSSSIRRTELDLLLDPIHQEEQGELESKRVVAKSVYNTVIRVTETPCQPGHQRVKEDGPCLKKYSSPTPLFDEESRLEHLKILHKQGALNHNRNRNRPNGHRNRHRTTTPATSSTTTTELPLVMSTLHDLEGGGEYTDDVNSKNPLFTGVVLQDREPQLPEVFNISPTVMYSVPELESSTDNSNSNVGIGSISKDNGNSHEIHQDDIQKSTTDSSTGNHFRRRKSHRKRTIT